jgi:hypothetical protein
MDSEYNKNSDNLLTIINKSNKANPKDEVKEQKQQKEQKNYAIEITNSEEQDIIAIVNKKYLKINTNTRVENSPRRDQMKIKENEIHKNFSYDKKRSKILAPNQSVSGNLNNNIILPKKHLSNETDKSIIDRIDKKITDNIRNRKDIDVLFNDPEINKYLFKEKHNNIDVDVDVDDNFNDFKDFNLEN